MTIATTLFAFLVCVGICASQNVASPALACNLKAISATERPRYNDLVKRLRLAVRERREMSDGYMFRLDADTISLTEVAEWMSMERRCCPFLNFQLSLSGNQDDWQLTLTGPKGVKDIITQELPAPPK
jgi:hypothetical protein